MDWWGQPSKIFSLATLRSPSLSCRASSRSRSVQSGKVSLMVANWMAYCCLSWASSPSSADASIEPALLWSPLVCFWDLGPREL